MGRKGLSVAAIVIRSCIVLVIRSCIVRFNAQPRRVVTRASGIQDEQSCLEYLGTNPVSGQA